MTDYDTGYKEGYTDAIKDASKSAAAPWEESVTDVHQRFIDWAYDQIGDDDKYDDALGLISDRLFSEDSDRLNAISEEDLRSELQSLVSEAGLFLDVDEFIKEDASYEPPEPVVPDVFVNSKE